MLETVVVLRQTLETATDSPPAVDTEPTLPAPETLGAQFNHRYKITYFFSIIFLSLLPNAVIDHREALTLPAREMSLLNKPVLNAIHPSLKLHLHLLQYGCDNKYACLSLSLCFL